MKKLLLFVFILDCFSQTQGYAQKSETRVEAPELKAKIEGQVSQAESRKSRPMALNEVLQDLDYSHDLFRASEETKRDVTIRLVKIYNSLDDSLTNTANKRRIISTIGMANNGPEAHEFFLSVLENGNELYRKEALRVIYFHIINGDDIYNKVKDLSAKGVIKNEEAFPALKGANSKRALSEIRNFVSTTKRPDEYVWGGILLCGYNDPGVLDVIVDRYDYFKSIPKTERPGHYDPTLSFDVDMLKKYIEVKEGSKLKKALEIFNDSGVFGESKLELLKRKLESSDAVSREAVADFLERQMDAGSVKETVVLPMLKEAYSRETNSLIKRRLKQIIEKKEHSPGRGTRK